MNSEEITDVLLWRVAKNPALKSQEDWLLVLDPINGTLDAF